MKRNASVVDLRLAAILLLAGSGCLSVLDAGTQDDAGPRAASGTSSGASASGSSGSAGGQTTTGVGSTGSSSGSSTGGSTTGIPPCTYPASTQGQFPYATLGDGWFNVTGAVDQSSGLSPEPDLLTQLHCSGKGYALIDVSAVWTPYGQALASQLPDQVSAWLRAGGIVVSVLEQNGAASGPASDSDLTAWAGQYGTNYSLVNDPQQALVSSLQILAWPTEYVVRLSDMAILFSQQGDDTSLFQEYTSTLAGDGGTN